jgi:signal peptidase I
MYLEALKQIFKITFSILLFITIPVVLFTLITSKIPLYGIQSFIVMSGSMEPSIPVGAVTYTIKLTDYKVGDVIAFKQGKNTITHRIVGVTESGYKTKGDANEEADSAIVPKSSIVGAQVYMFWNLGKLIMALKTIPGFIALLVIPAAFLIILEFLSIKKEFEKEIRKKVLEQVKNMEGSMRINNMDWQ